MRLRGGFCWAGFAIRQGIWDVQFSRNLFYLQIEPLDWQFRKGVADSNPVIDLSNKPCAHEQIPDFFLPCSCSKSVRIEARSPRSMEMGLIINSDRPSGNNYLKIDKIRELSLMINSQIITYLCFLIRAMNNCEFWNRFRFIPEASISHSCDVSSLRITPFSLLRTTTCCGEPLLHRCRNVGGIVCTLLHQRSHRPQ